jgi:hypothetical protein
MGIPSSRFAFEAGIPHPLEKWTTENFLKGFEGSIGVERLIFSAFT